MKEDTYKKALRVIDKLVTVTDNVHDAFHLALRVWSVALATAENLLAAELIAKQAKDLSRQDKIDFIKELYKDLNHGDAADWNNQEAVDAAPDSLINEVYVQAKKMAKVIADGTDVGAIKDLRDLGFEEDGR